MTASTIYLILFIATSLYAIGLQRIHDLYSPNFVWVTVVVGNAMIGGALAALCWADVLPWAAFSHLVGLNVAGGTPIIIWQLWQANQRRIALERRTHHAATQEGRSASH